MSGSILISSDSSEDVKPVISGDYDEKTVDDGSTIIDSCSSSESKGIIQISVATPTPTPTSPIVSKHSSNSMNNSNINMNNDVGVGGIHLWPDGGGCEWYRSDVSRKY